MLDIVQLKMLLSSLDFFKEMFGVYLQSVVAENKLKFKLLSFKENMVLSDLRKRYAACIFLLFSESQPAVCTPAPTSIN